MEERQRLYDLLDRLGVQDKLAREAIALLLEIDPELERPIDHDYQLVGEQIGRCYTTVSHRVRAGIKRAWGAPTAELERVFSVSICQQPVKPRHFLRIIKEISDKERSNQDDILRRMV